MTTSTAMATCIKTPWLKIVEIGTAMKTDKYLEKTSTEQVTWASARNSAISAALLATMTPAKGTAGADCKLNPAIAPATKGKRPAASNATTLCCMSCKKTATATTGKEVFGVKTSKKCSNVKTPATATVVNYYATTTAAVTEEWVGVCIEGAIRMTSYAAALITVIYMMA